MSTSLSASIVTDGLVFNYDMHNTKSYVGPPLTNILPNGINAGYPTYPSGWGTYNTNQYGSGTYFSIGTITGVSGNVITCPGHPLRTYDVVQPQTSGGGVTAGTNYLVRKWNSNEFSLYAYDGTQDSTNIFQTQVNLNTDNRISVSSGVTNMWWGYPHLPNSGIMKQIIPNGFQYKGRVHDCIRIHWYRADGVKDGMAYGNEPTITAGQTYTISFYHRAATPNCVGYSATINRWTNGEYTSDSFTVGKNWKKHSYTFTTSQSGTTYFYWFDNNTPAQVAFDLAEIMIYQGNGSSEYVPSNTTRSNTQAIYDLTGNNTITAQSLTYNSDGTFRLDSSVPGYLDLLNDITIKTSGGWTVESWVNFTTVAGAYDNTFSPANFIGSESIIYNSWYWSVLENKLALWNISPGVWRYGSTTLEPNIWYNCVLVSQDSGTSYQMYLNGKAEGGDHTTYSWNASNSGLMVRYFGRGNAGNTRRLNGYMSNVKIYNRALSASEVLQNFNAIKNRYLGESPDIPAESGYALRAARPELSSGYYWIKNSRMPNALRMYVDMSQEGGGYDFYPIQGNGISIGSVNGTHSGIALGLDLVYPRSKQHWTAMSNFVRNVLGSTGNEYFTTVYAVYRETSGGAGSRGGNYTGDIMRNPTSYGSGAPDWRVPDGGRWWLRDTTFSEPNGDYTAYNFLGGYTFPNPYSGQDLGFNDVTPQSYTTGAYYLLSTNAKP